MVRIYVTCLEEWRKFYSYGNVRSVRSLPGRTLNGFSIPNTWSPNSLLFRFGILLLFSPLIGSAVERLSVVPDKICVQSADTISSLIRSHRELYSLQRIHAFVPYISLVSSVAYLVIIKTQGSKSIVSFAKVTQGISDLRDMASSSNFAGRAANALQKITDLTMTGADPLSESNDNQTQNAAGASYSLGSALGFSAHRIFDVEGAPSSPLFSSFLSWVMTEVREK